MYYYYCYYYVLLWTNLRGFTYTTTYLLANTRNPTHRNGTVASTGFLILSTARQGQNNKRHTKYTSPITFELKQIKHTDNKHTYVIINAYTNHASPHTLHDIRTMCIPNSRIMCTIGRWYYYYLLRELFRIKAIIFLFFIFKFFFYITPFPSGN